jgi:hypothetical protein
VRVLLDWCVPERLRLAPAPLDVETARFAGLDDIGDGDLLEAAAGRFDVLVTCDQNLQWQQNLGKQRWLSWWRAQPPP